MACFALSSKHRWALTGTPIQVSDLHARLSSLTFLRFSQNGVEDLFSLLKFLGIRPLNDWSHFNDTIVKPVRLGRTSRAMKRLHVCLFSL